MYGESLGGPYAAYVATKRRVPAVVIENSFPSLRQLGNHLYRPFPLGWSAPFALTTSKWLNEAGVPVLVMHGRLDEVIPYSLGQRLYDDLHVEKHFLTSDSAGHCGLASAEGQRYYNAITEFVKRYH
jgi:pimeloyl-ACP methyl ester carboxylesterase